MMKRLLLAILMISSVTAVPLYMDQQGILRDNSNNLLTGMYIFNVTFNRVSDHTQMYSEERLIGVNQGVWNYVIGKGLSINPSIFEEDLYMNLTIGADEVGRINLTTVPYAFYSYQANNSNYLAGQNAAYYLQTDNEIRDAVNSSTGIFSNIKILWANINNKPLIINGTNGINGINGINGLNGTNGVDGINGTSFSVGNGYLYDNGSNVIFFNETMLNGTIDNRIPPDTDTWNTTAQVQNAVYTVFVEPNNHTDIQNKIDSCGTGYCKVIIPPGNYHIVDTIHIQNQDGVTLEGSGDYATQIYCPNNITCIEIGGNFSYYSTKNQIKNLKIVREAVCTSGTGIGIALNYTKNALVEKVEINGICGTGFLLTNYARYNIITNSMTNSIIGQALHITTPDDGTKKSMSNIITNNNLISIQETAVQIDNYADWNKINNNFIQTSNASVVVIGETGGGTTYGLQFSNNYIDYLGVTATYNAIETYDCNTCHLTGNLIQTQETGITLLNGVTKSGNTNARVFNNHCESDITTCGNDDLYYDAVSDFLLASTDEYICSYESTGTGIACDSSTSGTGAIVRQNGPGLYNPYLGLETNVRTTSGFIFYDATNDRIGVGDGTAADYFVPVGTVSAGGVCAYDNTNKIINCTSSNIDASSMESTDWGTMVNGKVCTYDSAATEVDCNTTMVVDTYNSTTDMRNAINNSGPYNFTEGVYIPKGVKLWLGIGCIYQNSTDNMITWRGNCT